MGSIPREHILTKCIACKSLWIKASAKCVNVNIKKNYIYLHTICWLQLITPCFVYYSIIWTKHFWVNIVGHYCCSSTDNLFSNKIICSFFSLSFNQIIKSSDEQLSKNCYYPLLLTLFKKLFLPLLKIFVFIAMKMRYLSFSISKCIHL